MCGDAGAVEALVGAFKGARAGAFSGAIAGGTAAVESVAFERAAEPPPHAAASNSDITGNPTIPRIAPPGMRTHATVRRPAEAHLL